MLGLRLYWLGLSLSWDEGERQLSCLVNEHVDSGAMLVDGCYKVLVGDRRTSIAMFVLLQVDTDLQKMSKFQTLEKEIITARSSVVNFQQMQ